MTTIITAGCSFSHYRYDPYHDAERDATKYPDDEIFFTNFTNPEQTWPNYIENEFENAIHLGISSVGNGIISRRVITTVSNFIETNDKNDLVVGIMWSGFARGDIYNCDTINRKRLIYENKLNGIHANPIWADHKNIDKINFIITSPWWKGLTNVNYYNALPIEHLMLISMEHVLRTQWFLKSNNIKYFMSSYTSDWVHKGLVSDNPDKHDRVLKSTWDMIDFNHWLPVTGCYEWCLENTDIPFRDDDNHPNSEQHKLFTEKVILPFIKEKKYV